MLAIVICVAQPYPKPGTGGSGTGQAGIVGHGSPQGAATATPGTIYWDTDNQLMYVKDSGSGNTGWAIH